MKHKLLLFTALLLLIAGAGNAQLKDIYNFTGSEEPQGNLTAVGNKLFGLAHYSGNNGRGYIFSINKDGSGYTDVWDFYDTGTVALNANGAYPEGTLTLAGNKLYGMTYGGGFNGYGLVFSINIDGSHFKDLWDFDDSGLSAGNANGAYPYYGQPLIVGNKIYGMTYRGGYGDYGLIFSLDTGGGAFKDMLDFNLTINGAHPFGSLILSGSKLLGTTWGITCSDCRTESYGYGNVFSIDTNGTQYKDVYVFAGPNGENPYCTLALSPDGKRIYGTGYDAGPNSNDGEGIVFGVDTDGNRFKVLTSFNDTNGSWPQSSLVLSSSGILYGTTPNGGSYFRFDGGYGAIFALDTNGARFTDLYSFDISSGENPYGGVIFAGDSLYGMAEGGGFEDDGTIFACSPAVPTGINTIAKNNGSLSVYPNPSRGVFQLKITNGAALMNSANNGSGVNNYEVGTTNTVEVYNMLGEKIYSQSGGQNSIVSIDLSSQPNGVYMYRVISLNGNVVGEGKAEIQK